MLIRKPFWNAPFLVDHTKIFGIIFFARYIEECLKNRKICMFFFVQRLTSLIDFKWIFSIDIFRQCSFITIFFLVENYEKWIISSIGTCSTRFLRVWKCFPREYYQEAWIRLLMANHRGIFAEMKTAARLSRPSLKHSFFLAACASASLFPRKIPFLFRRIVTIP